MSTVGHFVQRPDYSTKTPLGTVCNSPAVRCPCCGCWTWPSRLGDSTPPVLEIAVVTCRGRRGMPRKVYLMSGATGAATVETLRFVLQAIRQRIRLVDAAAVVALRRLGVSALRVLSGPAVVRNFDPRVSSGPAVVHGFELIPVRRSEGMRRASAGSEVGGFG